MDLASFGEGGRVAVNFEGRWSRGRCSGMKPQGVETGSGKWSSRRRLRWVVVGAARKEVSGDWTMVEVVDGGG